MININLYDIRSPMLLVPAKTGVTYHHQYSGASCYQAEIEGFIVPLGYSVMFAGKLFDDYGQSEVRRVIAGLRHLIISDHEFKLALREEIDTYHDEAFLPVTSPWGDAWLIWANSD